MANVWSIRGFDMYSLRIGVSGKEVSDFHDNAYLAMAANSFAASDRYRDSFSICDCLTGGSAFDYYLGSDEILVDPSTGRITGGSVRGFAAYTDGPTGPAAQWGFGNANVSAVDFQAALCSVKAGDFRAMLALVLAGDDSFSLSDAADKVYGAGGKDKFFGNSGNDTIVGGAGVDTIYGGSDDDKLIGGIGADQLYGDAGMDSFVFNTSPRLGVDRIWYFSSADDTIVLENEVFHGLAKGALRPGAFEVNTEGHAHFAATRIIFNSADQTLSYDADGLGGAGAMVFAKLGVYGPFGNVTVTADDFLIV